MATDFILIFIALFVPGLALTITSAYVFLRDRSKNIAGIPLWMPMLLVGLAMTLVVPAAVLFLGSVTVGELAGRLVDTIVHPSPTPLPMCYKPAPPSATPTAGALMAAGLARSELLEKLAKEGRIPEKVYCRLREKK